MAAGLPWSLSRERPYSENNCGRTTRKLLERIREVITKILLKACSDAVDVDDDMSDRLRAEMVDRLAASKNV